TAPMRNGSSSVTSPVTASTPGRSDGHESRPALRPTEPVVAAPDVAYRPGSPVTPPASSQPRPRAASPPGFALLQNPIDERRDVAQHAVLVDLVEDLVPGV